MPTLPTPPALTTLREPARVALHARDVAFDWAGLPLRWIPGEDFASHMLNVLHIMLPEGERWFVKVFGEALPLIQDDQLREDVIGFIGQEGMHAAAHQAVQDYFTAQGLDTSAYVADIEHLFRRLLGDRHLTGRKADEWLVERLAVVAAVEHVTAFLGNWILNSPGLDIAGADPRMLDLLRWHGAEEVEHRAVAFDVYDHIDGRYVRRVRTYAVAATALCYLWARGISHLMTHDPHLPPGRSKAHWRSLIRTARKGLTPSYLDIVGCAWRYFQPGYHPSSEGSTSQAARYLASSPAALAADGLAPAGATATRSAAPRIPACTP